MAKAFDDGPTTLIAQSPPVIERSGRGMAAVVVVAGSQLFDNGMILEFMQWSKHDNRLRTTPFNTGDVAQANSCRDISMPR
jgi:hypothetical protein